MSVRYRYNHRAVKRHHVVGIILGIAILMIGVLVMLLMIDVRNNQNITVEGTSRVVGQVVGDESGEQTIEHELFSFTLPSDWKEVSRTDSATEQSITWTGTTDGDSARDLKIYIDTIPSDLPVNRLLSVNVQSSRLLTGTVSANCATFTQGGTIDAQKATQLQPAQARWEGVDFICNLTNVVENKVGASSAAAINTIPVEGPTKGLHRYFFLYNDQNIQPKYNILSDALNSFMPK